MAFKNLQLQPIYMNSLLVIFLKNALMVQPAHYLPLNK